jgi:predicted ATPase
MHFERGRDYARAVPYLQQAAETALQRHAPQEARQALRRALELLAQLSDTPARTQQELTLHLMLGPALMATQGQANPEVQQVYAHAHALCQQVGDSAELVSALHGLWLSLLVQGKFPAAQEVADQCFRLTRRHRDLPSLLVAHRAMGSTLFYRGEFLLAQPHLQQGRALYNSPGGHTPVGRYFFNPGLLCAIFRVLSLWLLGYPAQARQQLQETLALAQELAHPPTLVLVLNYYCDEPAIQALNQAALQVATKQEFALWLAEGEVIRGWAGVAQGAGEAGCAQVHQNVATMRSAGGMLWQPYHLTVLGELYGSIGQIDRGLGLLAEALALMQTNGEHWYEAEAQRLRGELLLQRPTPAIRQAETCFQQALALARQQGAKSWELRSAMSLSRLWQQQGKRYEARRLLTNVYSWFTEGFDTADLRAAQALLETPG